MVPRIALLLALCGAGLPLLAQEPPRSGAVGCPTALSADDRDGAARGVADQRRADSESVSRDKPVRTQQGGNAENSVRGPRMHSFLPGMFR